MNLNTDITATGIVVPDEYTEPTHVGIETIEFNPEDVRTKRELQNRKGTKARQLKSTDDGFFVYADSVDSISEHFLNNARNGVSSENAVPALTVARMNGETYLIGGHHRAAGLVLARQKVEKASDLDAEKDAEIINTFFGDSDETVQDKLAQIQVDVWECKNEYEMRILADRENSESQHGERNTVQERDAMIRDILLDPYKRQYSDMAIAIKFLGYPKARGKIQKDRAKMVKAGEIDKIAKTIDVNGTPRKASRPGAKAIDMLNSNTEKLETAMNEYQELTNNATLVSLGEAAGTWKDAWKNAVQYLNDEEKSEMTEWLSDLYADVEGVDSPLKHAAPVQNTTPTDPITESTTESKTETKSDDTVENTEVSEPVDDVEDDDTDADVLNEIQSAAAGTTATPSEEPPLEESREVKSGRLINTLADAVSLVMELELGDDYVNRLEGIISDLCDADNNDAENNE